MLVIDYSTTWCGPCKVIAPKFEELSNTYQDAIFLKCVGDSSTGITRVHACTHARTRTYTNTDAT